MTERLSYPHPATSWQQAELPTTALTALVLALLTTLISYQLTAFIMDVTLGSKPRRVARVHTFHTLLLSRKSSPLAVLNALFRWDTLTRKYFQGNLPERGAITRDRAKVKWGAVLLLFSLILAAPLVNILSVVLIIERETSLSFSEAGFGGWRFGLGRNKSYETERITEVCSQFLIDYDVQDRGIATLGWCKTVLGPVEVGNEIQDRNSGGIGVLSTHGINLMLQVRVKEEFMEVHYTGIIITKSFDQPEDDGSKKTFLMRSEANIQTAKAVVDSVTDTLIEVCGSSQTSGEVKQDYIGERLEAHQKFLYGISNVTCEAVEDTWGAMMKVVMEIEKFVTVTRGDRLDIIFPEELLSGDREYRDASGELFVMRRSRLVGLAVLGIVAGISVVGRLVAACLFNNDVNDGMERLVKERIGVPYCCSLLKEGDTIVSYNAKSDDGMGTGVLPGDGRNRSKDRTQGDRSGGGRNDSTRTIVMFDGGVSRGESSMDQIDYVSRAYLT